MPHSYKYRYLVFLSAGLLIATTGRTQNKDATASGNITISGRVLDSVSKQTLTDATISLFQNDSLIRRTRSKSQFNFSLPNRTFVLIITYQGYISDTVIIRGDSAKRQLVIALVPEEQKLLQVVIRAQIPPAVVRNDTIAFNAGAYPTPANSTVEDLIRKLPGVQIDEQGNVTMQGQKVDKITIDGKDFFISDLRTATRNLPADIIAQVETFDTQSQRAKRMGVKGNSNTKTINLKLKKNKKQGYFAKLYAGYGTNDAYAAGANATRFHANEWLFANFEANRNIQTISNNTQLDFRDEWGKTFKATLNGSRNYYNSSQQTKLDKQTILTDSSIIENRISSRQNKSTNYTANSILEFTPDTFTQININSSYANNHSSSITGDSVAITTQKPPSNYLSSLGATSNESEASSYNISNSLDFSRRFKKKGRLIYFNATQSLNRETNPQTLKSIVQTLDSTAIINQQANQQTNNNAYALSASWVEPVGKRHLLDFGYSFSHTTGHSDKASYNYDSISQKYNLPDSLTSNRFLNHTTLQKISGGYNTTEGKYRFQIGLTAQLTQLENLNLVTSQNLHQQSVNWYPRAGLLWAISKNKNLNLNYSGNTQTPTIEELQPVPDLTNPYLIRIGNPDLRQQLTHDLSVAYSSFNQKSFQNLQINLSGNYIQNQITTASAVLQGGIQQIQAINVQGNYHLNSTITYGFPLGNQQHGNASIGLNTSLAHESSVVNNQTNTTQTTGIGGNAKVNYHASSKLFIDAEASVNDTRSTYSLALSPTTETLNENYRIHVTYILPLAITIASTYNLQVTGSQNNLPAQSASILNASVSKAFLPNRSAELRLTATDLLNSASAISQSTGINYTQTTQTNLPGRILLFSFIYRFNKFQAS